MMEDIFAENLVDEPDDIERVIEDGEELRRDSDGGSDDEVKKKEEEKEKEKPKIRKTLGPRPVLNAQRLKGPRGIATLEEFYKRVKLDGRRSVEGRDLDVIMKRLELWTHRLFPRGQFDDCLKKMEKLGTNKLVRNYITRIRLGMEDGSGESDVVREPNSPPPIGSNEDPFDTLVSSTSRPPQTTIGPNVEISSEQRDRMLTNRLIAEDRRAARIKRAQELQESFRAQQAEKSQSESGVYSTEATRNIAPTQRLEETAGVVQMEVDDSHGHVIVGTKQKGSKGTGSPEVNTKSAEIAIHLSEKANATDKPSTPLGSEEGKVNLERKIYQEVYLCSAEERRAARIKRARELQERFRAQQAAKAHSENRVSSTHTEAPSDITQDKKLENMQMGVDGSHGTSSVKQRGNEGSSSSKISTESSEMGSDSSDKGNETGKLSTPLGRDEGGEHLVGNVDLDCSAKEIPMDCVNQEEHRSQERCGNVSISNGTEQEENKTTEEMEICEVTSSTDCLSEKLLTSIEKNKLKGNDLVVGHNKVKEKEVSVFKEQTKIEESADCFEKENENPNQN